MRTGATVLLLLAAAAVTAVVGGAVAQADTSQRLEETRAQIAEIEEQLEAAQQKEADQEAALAEVRRRFQAVMAEVNAAEQAVYRQKQAVQRVREELASLRKRAEQQRNATQARAVSLYKQGASGLPGSAILEADSAREALRRSSYVEMAAQADREAIEGLAATAVALDAKREELKQEQAHLETVVERRRTLMAEVKALRDQRAMQLALTREQVNQLQAQENHLESESRELAVLARRAQQAEAAEAAAEAGGSGGNTVGAAAQTGGARQTSASGWTWPASGPLTSGYGYRWGRMHEGVDIGAPMGSPVYAARPGTVRYAGRRGGYGNLTLITHGGGVATAYAHQSAIHVTPGERVSAGERIGSIGSTGHSTGPHLHFEVRVNGSPRNPLPYLP